MIEEAQKQREEQYVAPLSAFVYDFTLLLGSIC
jgi:hypothetical protein